METTYIPPGSIVVGVDGSESCSQALAWAAEEAALDHRPLVLINAVGTLGTPGTVWLTGVDPVVQEMRRHGEEVAAAAAREVASRHSANETLTSVVTDDARQALLAAAERAHMVVVGSRGRGPVRSLLLGSVSSAVARHATCPVVVVRPHRIGVVRRGVLVGADGTSESQPALDFAYREASIRRLPLTVMHCVSDTFAVEYQGAVVPPSERRLEDARLILAESVAGMTEKYPDVHVTVQVSPGLPEQTLRSAAERMDLLVVGSRSPNMLSRAAAGDVAGHLVEHARTVVAVVPRSAGPTNPGQRDLRP
ncbi:universal stress protein [Nocardioides endophyticus]|uniref:Universal stress protein n=1 Tax=Nocardioides endophyticus TaxID=1353775 RepID=A0ABP8Z1V2_9ACTN